MSLKRIVRAIQKTPEAKIGFAEALAAEDDSLAELLRGIPVLVGIIGSTVKRQNEITARQALIKVNQSCARQQLNQTWIDHAANLRRTTAKLRDTVPTLLAAARTLRECQERQMDWQREYQKGRPPERWINEYDKFVSFRTVALNGKTVFMNSEAKWSPVVRAMHRELDSAVVEHLPLANQVSQFFAELESFCGVIITAVDKWNRRRWLMRRIRAAWSRIKPRKAA